jgi:hypothetical protein
METTKKVRIEFNADELETIYTALNRLCCHYSDKSESLKKICENCDNGNPAEFVPADYFMELWLAAGALQNRIYKAQKRIK